MSLLRLSRGAPLAVSVAVLAHLAAFGFDHGPGGSHSAEFLRTLGAGLLLALLSTFLGMALGRPATFIATSRRHRYLPLELAAGGIAAYAAIELCEGHFSLGGGLRALVAMLQAAAGLALVAKFAGRAADRAAAAFARFAFVSRAPAGLVFRLGRGVTLTRQARVSAGKRRGRAPPAFA